MKNPEWIGHVYASEFGWEVLRDLALGGARLGGSAGERVAHERVAEAFRDAGLRDVDQMMFDVPQWTRGRASLSVECDHATSLDCIALPKSPSRAVRGPIVDLGHGLPEDFEEAEVDGAIVLVRSDVPLGYDHWVHRLVKYRLAVTEGAAGFVFANHIEGSLPPTGSVGVQYDQIGEIPAVGVSREVGENLRRMCANANLSGELAVEADIEEGRSRNVSACVGPETGREIVLGAHVDAHDIAQGANDNGTGVAIMCDAARALAMLGDELGTRVRFVGFGAEEYGMGGSTRYVEECDPGDVKLAINLDSLGKGRSLQVHDNCFEGIGPPVQQLRDELAHPFEYHREYASYSDHWPFVSAGIPGIMISAVTDHEGRGYVHTDADTLDKIDIRAVRDHAILTTRLVVLLARDEVEIPHRTPKEICEELRDQGQEKWLRLAGDWPCD